MFRSTKVPKILMVEDNLNNHELYRQAFVAKGFEVMICQSADDDFLEVVADYQPDIISMDLMLGKEGGSTARDGFQAIEILKADSRTNVIPVMVVSNFFQTEKVEHAKSLGVVDYFNLQGQSIPIVASKMAEYVRQPKKYRASHELFRES